MQKSFYTLFILAILLFTSLSANKPSDKKVKAYRIKAPLMIDGILDEALYSEVPIDDFTQKDPNEGEPISTSL